MANDRRISVDIQGGWYNQLLHEIHINRDFSNKVLELSDYYDSDAVIAHNEMIARDDRVLTRLKNNLARTGEAIISPRDYEDILYILLENACVRDDGKEDLTND